MAIFRILPKNFDFLSVGTRMNPSKKDFPRKLSAIRKFAPPSLFIRKTSDTQNIATESKTNDSAGRTLGLGEV